MEGCSERVRDTRSKFSQGENAPRDNGAANGQLGWSSSCMCRRAPVRCSTVLSILRSTLGAVVEWSILIRTMQPVASKMVTSRAQKMYLPWQVARQLRKRGAEGGIPLPDYAPLRKYLSREVALEAFRSADPALYDGVRSDLIDICARLSVPVKK